MEGTSPTVVLRLTFAATDYIPSTELVYRTVGAHAAIVETKLLVNGVAATSTASNDIFELTYRYREKSVSQAILRIGEIEHIDADGDGLVHAGDGPSRLIPAWELLLAAFPNYAGAVTPLQRQPLFPIVPDLSGSQAWHRSFRATCGSLAAVVHELRGHSLLWASIPPHSAPNDVHRHLGGTVYCIFYHGTGRFHRLTPDGFETLSISISDSNPFQMVALADHLWYQPINTGASPLLYFMTHAPAFEHSEMLSLPKYECRDDWEFEW
jgi:hypothetical protein